MGLEFFTVDAAAAGQRLDVFVAGRCPEPKAGNLHEPCRGKAAH